MANMKEVNEALSKAMAFEHTGMRLAKDGFRQILLTDNNNKVADIKIDSGFNAGQYILDIDVFCKVQDRTIGNRCFNLTSKQADKVRELLDKTYWPEVY